MCKDIKLRAAKRSDIEMLRKWKNSCRNSFFHKSYISPAQQAAWFKRYSEDKGNLIFMVIYRNKPVGCAGFKVLRSGCDIYNIILGEGKLKGKGIMSAALESLISYLRLKGFRRITLKVLKSNRPAINFYRKNGFSIERTYPDYLLLRLSQSQTV